MVTRTGTNGRDTLTGTEDDDILIGLRGDDTLEGLGGDDTLRPGLGRNVVDGGDGIDTVDYRDISGGLTRDSRSRDIYRSIEFLIATDSRDDFVINGIPHIRLRGGDDDLLLDDFVSIVFGGLGNDEIDGGDVADTLYGGPDNDRLFGRLGNDTLYGGAGIDSLEGGRDDDILFGGLGNDFLDDGAGRDELYGQGGDDTFRADGGAGSIYDGGNGDDSLTFFAGGDYVIDIQVRARSTGAYQDVVIRSIENFTLLNGIYDFYGDDEGQTVSIGGGFANYYGRGGDDTFASAAGSQFGQIFDGGDGFDGVSYAFEGRPIVVDLIRFC